jgi:hypothetical protein
VNDSPHALEGLHAAVDLPYFVPAEPRFEGIDAASNSVKQTADQANNEGDNDQEMQEREMLEQLAQGLKTH